MLQWSRARSRHRLLLVALTGSFALTQLFFLHAHHFTDHLAKYGDTHVAEVHGTMMPISVDHGDMVESGTEGTLSVLKLFTLKFLALFSFVILIEAVITTPGHPGIRAARDPAWPFPPHGFPPLLRGPPR